jgi:hypothetical protein
LMCVKDGDCPSTAPNCTKTGGVFPNGYYGVCTCQSGVCG